MPKTSASFFNDGLTGISKDIIDDPDALASFRSLEVRLPVDRLISANLISSFSILSKEFLTASNAPLDPAFTII